MVSVKTVLDLDRQIAELQQARETAIRDLVDDLSWMDVEVLRVPESYAQGVSAGGHAQVVQQVDERTGKVRHFLSGDGDVLGTPWGVRPEGTGPHFTRGRRGARLGHTNLGRFVAIGKLGNEWLLVPDAASVVAGACPAHRIEELQAVGL